MTSGRLLKRFHSDTVINTELWLLVEISWIPVTRTACWWGTGAATTPTEWHPLPGQAAQTSCSPTPAARCLCATPSAGSTLPSSTPVRATKTHAVEKWWTVEGNSSSRVQSRLKFIFVFLPSVFVKSCVVSASHREWWPTTSLPTTTMEIWKLISSSLRMAGSIGAAPKTQSGKSWLKKCF